MSDSEARLDFSADDSKSKAVVDRQTKQIAGLEEQVRLLNERVKKGTEEAVEGFKKWHSEAEKMKGVLSSDAFMKDPWAGGKTIIGNSEILKKHVEQHSEIHHWLSEQGKELLTLGTGYLGIKEGVKAIGEFIGGWREELDKAGEAQEAFNTKLIRGLALSGDLKEADAIGKFLGGIPGVTREQASAAFSGVRETATGASLQRRQQLTEAATAIVPAVSSEEDVKGFGRAVGSLGGILPQMEAGDVGDLATKLQTELQGDMTQFDDEKTQRSIRALVAGGMSPEHALGLFVAGRRAHLSKGAVPKLAHVLGGSKEALMPGATDYSPDAMRMRKLAGMTTAEREQSIFTDESMRKAAFGRDEGIELGRLSPALAAQSEAGLLQAKLGDERFRPRNDLTESEAGGEATLAQQAAVSQSKSHAMYGSLADQRKNIRATIRSEAKQRGLFQHWNAGVSTGLSRFADLFDYRPEGGGREEMSDEVRAAVFRGGMSQEKADELIAALDRNTSKTEENTRSSKADRWPTETHGERGP